MSNVQDILNRIEVSSKHSPITVFANNFRVWSVFGRTVKTNMMIKDSEKNNFITHVGTFDSSYNPTTVRRLLNEAESMVR
jgi:hypothetical protein